MAILSAIWKALTGGSKTNSPQSQPSANIPLPTSSVAAVAGAIIQTERMIEKQVELRNTPEMQKAKSAQLEQSLREKIEKDVANRNLDETRKDIAD